jgi:cytochrome P450
MMLVAARPRGPKGQFPTGNLPEFSRDRLGFLTACAREYGDFVPFRLGPRPFVLLSHPDYVEYVLVANNDNFRKHYLLRMNRLLLGNGLLTSEGDLWRRQRRLAQPAFHRQRIAAYGEVMVEYAERMLATWRDGEVRDVHADMTRLTLEIVAKTLFDADVAGEAGHVGAALEVVMETFIARMDSLLMLPESVPTPTNLRLQRAVRQLDEIVYGIIAHRRASGEDRGDPSASSEQVRFAGQALLSMLLRARDEDDGGRMTDKQLRDETMTLFLAGHETTAIALSWTWYLLARHPEVVAKLEAELDATLGGRAPTVADLPRLPYAGMVVSEAMRLYPPAYAFGREAIGDCEIGGHRVTAGTTVIMSPWVLHRDRRFYDEPEAFDPDRWAHGLARRLPKYAYFPFGGGPRVCIGASFATMEATLLLAAIARRFRLALASDAPITPQPAITLRPKDGIRVLLRARPASG